MRVNGPNLAEAEVAVFDVAPADTGPLDDPLVIIHGFPTSSFDWAHLVDRLADRRRVVLLDLPGFGLSDKPNQRYTIAGAADAVVSVCAQLGLDRFALLTHDMGDTVGGELLARQMEGVWDVTVTRRIVTNGSIYIDMAHLTDGQLLLLSLPDEPGATGPGPELIAASLVATLSAYLFVSAVKALESQLAATTGDAGSVAAQMALGLARSEGYRKLLSMFTLGDLQKAGYLAGLPPMGLFMVLAMLTLIPWMVALTASDQVAGDLHLRTVRFVALRASRSAFVLGKLLSQVLLVAAVTSGQTVRLTGLLPQTTYRFRGKHTDAAGNVSANYSTIITGTTLAVPTGTVTAVCPCKHHR